MCTFKLKEVVAAFIHPAAYWNLGISPLLLTRALVTMPCAGEKIIHSSVRMLVALRQSKCLSFSQLWYFFYLLMNDRVLMHSSTARARACLRACWRGSLCVKAWCWLCARAGVALRACGRGSACSPAQVCVSACLALCARRRSSARAPALEPCMEYISHIPSSSKYMPYIWGNVMTPKIS